jgi:hypothetical protein
MSVLQMSGFLNNASGYEQTGLLSTKQLDQPQYSGGSMIRTKMQSFNMTRALILSGLFITGLLGGTAVAAFPASGSFALTGSLNTARYDHSATLLPNGEVLVTGGLAACLWAVQPSLRLCFRMERCWWLAERAIPPTALLLPNSTIRPQGDGQPLAV